MRIDLKSWKSYGLRCPNVEVNLVNSAGHPETVSLIQMPNGTGKTTTLELLRAAFNGEAKTWDPETIRRYAPRDSDPTNPGQFIVNLLIDSNPLTIELTLDFQQGQARYYTTHPGSGGRTPGWTIPPNVHRFFSPQFIDLFVFDGELANGLLDPRRAEAEKAIDALCQLYLLDDISSFVKRKWEEAASSGPKTSLGLKQAENRRGALVKRIKEITAAKSKADQESSNLNTEIGELEQLISDHISGIASVKDQYQAAMISLTNAKNDVQLASGALMDLIRQPHMFHHHLVNRLSNLKDNLDKLKLPENTSAQFFDELVNEVECICGREMTTDAKEHIKVRAADYLGAAEAGIINALKSDIEQYVIPGVGEDSNKMNYAANALNFAARAHKKGEQLVNTLHQQLIDKGDTELEKWKNQLVIHKERKNKFDSLLISINSAPSDDENNVGKIFSLQHLNKLLSETEKKISEITGTLELKSQTEKIEEIASKAKNLAREQIRDSLLGECNNRLKLVLSHNPVELEKIDRSLKLKGQAGASVGQTLAVGYTFLMSVLNRGKNEFPLIVDSPAGPLDAARRRVIGRLIPELCGQFVGLTISTEKLGFVDALEQTGAGINYTTIFRKTPGTETLVSHLPSTGVTQTENGVLVTGREYFNEFDLEEEPS